MTNYFRYITLLSVLLLAAPGRVVAEQLPLKAYHVADGLPHDFINKIMRDSRGFLWFTSQVGLGRFDGYRFSVYGREQGLPNSYINMIMETRRGSYWIAFNGGGALLFHPYEPDKGSRFKAYQVGKIQAANRVNSLYEDRAGRIWAGTDGGLFCLDVGGNEFLPVPLGIASLLENQLQILTTVEDQEGSLWIGTKFGLSRRLPDGQIINYSVQPSKSGRDVVYALMFDGEGRLWLGHEVCMIILKPQPISAVLAGERSGWARLSRFDTLNQIATMPAETGDACLYQIPTRVFLITGDGHIWIGSVDHGLIEFDGEKMRSFTTVHGLNADTILSLAEDIEGNLWFVCNGNGVMRLSRNGFVNYTRADGLRQDMIGSIFEGRSGELYVHSGNWGINRLEGNRFASARLNLPPRITDSMWRGFRSVIQDRDGDLWVATTEGLYRFAKTESVEQLARAEPKGVYTASDGLVSDDVHKLFEDSRGDIWITTFAPGLEIMARWERATGRFYRYSDKDGLQPFNAVNSFCEDAAGQVWIGFREGGFARFASGRFTLFGTADGLPASTAVSDLHIDRSGRLWIALQNYGLIRCDAPLAARPQFIKVIKREELSEVGGIIITEDAEGQLYFCTYKSINRYDPVTERIKHFTTIDELKGTLVTGALRDKRGYLWFSTNKGLARFIPVPDRPLTPPVVFINGLRIAGKSFSVSDFGQNEVNYLELEPGQNQIQIDYFSLNFAPGDPLRYQYKIEGAGQDWSRPTEQRTVEISLGPGSYRFLVRAARADGSVSNAPAGFSFRILPPFWQRWQFILLVALSIALTFYAIVRYRIRRLLEIERVRTRIATDLHDDIGASLSQVSVLTEIIRRRAGSDPGVSEPLSTISRLSGDLVDSMSDIVWAINPQKDHLGDLTQRMRRFASDVFTARNLEFNLETPADHYNLKMDANMRRELFLIFKESVNNIIRHSGCSKADIKFRVSRRELELIVSDNGKGFDVSQERDGNGLINMRLRAEKIGGKIEVISEAGNGSTVILKAPLDGKPAKLPT